MVALLNVTESWLSPFIFNSEIFPHDYKSKYLSAAELRYTSFTPFVLSVDKALGFEDLMLVQCYADCLSSGWGKSYGHVIAWIRVCLAFAII